MEWNEIEILHKKSQKIIVPVVSMFAFLKIKHVDVTPIDEAVTYIGELLNANLNLARENKILTSERDEAITRSERAEGTIAEIREGLEMSERGDDFHMGDVLEIIKRYNEGENK